jgi:RNA polymerase-binding transcription factor DksA
MADESAQLRALLAEERSRTRERIAALRRDNAAILEGMALTSTDDEHDPEGQTTAVDRSRTDALLAGAERHLVDLDEAEQRLDEGAFGRCEVCGRPIPLARLRVRPAARTCVDCAG